MLHEKLFSLFFTNLDFFLFTSEIIILNTTKLNTNILPLSKQSNITDYSFKLGVISDFESSNWSNPVNYFLKIHLRIKLDIKWEFKIK